MLLIVGFLAGTASGLFGIGGGVIVVPALVLSDLLGFKAAVAASLFVILLTAPLGVRRHHVHHNVAWRAGLILGLAGFVGVLLGGLIGLGAGEKELTIAFAVLLVLAARHLAYSRRRTGHGPSMALLVLAGIASGLVAKLFGIGGGIVIVPAMVWGGFDIHVAVGTSLLAVLTNAAASTALNAPGLLEWIHVVPALVIGSLVGIPFGTMRSVRMHGDRLGRAFAMLLLLVALSLLRQAYAT